MFANLRSLLPFLLLIDVSVRPVYTSRKARYLKILTLDTFDALFVPPAVLQDPDPPEFFQCLLPSHRYLSFCLHDSRPPHRVKDRLASEDFNTVEDPPTDTAPPVGFPVPDPSGTLAHFEWRRGLVSLQVTPAHFPLGFQRPDGTDPHVRISYWYPLHSTVKPRVNKPRNTSRPKQNTQAQQVLAAQASSLARNRPSYIAPHREVKLGASAF